jgi:hypothetical protein
MVSGYTRVLEKFEDSKGVIRGPKSKKDRQCNGQKKKDKKTSNSRRLTYITIPFFLHSWLVIGFLTRVTRRVPPVEQELVSFPENLSSSLVFSWLHVAQSFVFCVVFCRPTTNDGLIDWCLTPTSAVFQLYRGALLICNTDAC